MPLAKEDFAEYQRLRRSAKYPCMGCGAVGGATERYKATAAAAEIRCCKPCHRKITAALQPDKAPEMVGETPAPPMLGLPDTYEERIRISLGAPWTLGSVEDRQAKAISKALSDALDVAMREGLVREAMADRAREIIYGVKNIKPARFSTLKT